MANKPTEGQMMLIRQIERRTGKKFWGDTYSKAHNYIKRFGNKRGV